MVAGPATTGNTFILNNMEGRPMPLPVATILQPEEEINVRLEMRMHQGMGGPHRFLIKFLVDGEGGDPHPPLEFDIKALFG